LLGNTQLTGRAKVVVGYVQAGIRDRIAGIRGAVDHIVAYHRGARAAVSVQTLFLAVAEDPVGAIPILLTRDLVTTASDRITRLGIADLFGLAQVIVGLILTGLRLLVAGVHRATDPVVTGRLAFPAFPVGATLHPVAEAIIVAVGIVFAGPGDTTTFRIALTGGTTQAVVRCVQALPGILVADVNRTCDMIVAGLAQALGYRFGLRASDCSNKQQTDQTV
jgi:hypothetical protein